jgi:purine-binding chemotaxis protein CheW
MSQAPPRNPWIPPQAEALPLYLEALLRETWEVPVQTFEPVDLASPAEVPLTTAAPAAVIPTAAPTALPDLHAPADPLVTWAAAAFEVQLFQVAGLTLALPVSELVGIVDSTDLVAAGGEATPWQRGCLCYQHGEIQVVDTAHWVLPPGMPGPSAIRPYPVLIIAGGRWGLACDVVGTVITLDPATVRWRSIRTQRRWLAGMVSQPGCALLDPAQFAALLAEALASHPRP